MLFLGAKKFTFWLEIVIIDRQNCNNSRTEGAGGCAVRPSPKVNQRGDILDEQETDGTGRRRRVRRPRGGHGASGDLRTRQPRLRQLLGYRRERRVGQRLEGPQPRFRLGLASRRSR